MKPTFPSDSSHDLFILVTNNLWKGELTIPKRVTIWESPRWERWKLVFTNTQWNTAYNFLEPPMTSTFAGQPPKTRPFSIKARVIWVLGYNEVKLNFVGPGCNHAFENSDLCKQPKLFQVWTGKCRENQQFLRLLKLQKCCSMLFPTD